MGDHAGCSQYRRINSLILPSILATPTPQHTQKLTRDIPANHTDRIVHLAAIIEHTVSRWLLACYTPTVSLRISYFVFVSTIIESPPAFYPHCFHTAPALL